MPKYYFDHVHLASPDPKKTAEAYAKMFGVKIEYQDMGGGRIMAKLDLGGTIILVSPTRDGQNGLLHFGIRTDNLAQAVKTLKADGVKFTQEPKQIRPNVTISYLTGPEDVSIELEEGSL